MEWETQDQGGLGERSARVSWSQHTADGPIASCPSRASLKVEPETRDVGAGILFQRGPKERQQREQKGYVLGGRKPIKGVLMSPGQLGLGASGTLQNRPSRARDSEH